MKKDLLYRTYFGKSEPRITTDEGRTYAVMEHTGGRTYAGYYYDIVFVDSWSYAEVSIYQGDGKLWKDAPHFSSKIHAVKYMLENYDKFCIV